MAPFTNAEKLHLLEIRIDNTYTTRSKRRRSIFTGWQPNISHHSYSWSPPHIDYSISSRDTIPNAVNNDRSRSSLSTLSTNQASLLTQGVEKAVKGQPNDADAALTVFLDQLRNNQRPSAQACDTLISLLYSQQRHVDVRKLYKLIDRFEYQLKYNTYQAILRSLLAINDIDAALDVFRDLQQRGMAPNKVTYCCLISALGKQRRRRGSRYTHVAYDLWQELRTASSSSSSSSIGDLDPVALRTGMKACVDVGKIHEAEELLQMSIQKTGKADVRAYNIIIKGHALNKNITALVSVVDDMKAAGIQPSSVTFNILIDAHARAGMLEKAREIMSEAAATDGVALDAWSYTSLIKACVEKDDMDGAARIWEEMKNAGITATCITYSTLIDGYVRRRDVDMARSLLDEMIAAGAEPSAVTYNSLLRGYIDTDGSIGSMSSIGSSRDDDNDNDNENITTTINPNNTTTTPPKGKSLLYGLELLDSMHDRGILPAVDTFNTLMSAAVATDDSLLALDLYQRLLDAGLRPDGVTYTVLMMAYGRLGRVADAVGAFESLSRDPNAAMDIAAYNAMVDAFARTGEMAAAEKMVDSACKFAKKSKKPPPVEAFGALVAGYARLQHVEAAVRAVRRFHAAGGSPDEQMLDQLAELGVRTGEFKVAMQAVRALELMGRSIDKEKYKEMVLRRMKVGNGSSSAGIGGGEGGSEMMMTTTTTSSSSMPTTSIDTTNSRGLSSSSSSSKKKGTGKSNLNMSKNVYLERFKFWLGLPNNYYDSCDDG